MGETSILSPSPTAVGRPLGYRLHLWFTVPKSAELEDIRLHVLQQTYARHCHAVMQRLLPVAACLLNHRQTTMTPRYVHTGDRETEAAAERVGGMMFELLGMSPIV